MATKNLFSREQMVQWFDGSHMAKSPAQWDPAKLAWVNAHYIKVAADRGWPHWWWRTCPAPHRRIGRRSARLAQRCALF
jgi:glutamyl-tRNA synthetase